MTTCNGWTNYATWRVNLEMLDGIHPEALYLRLGVGKGWPTDDAYSLSDILRDFCEDTIAMTSTEGLARDYALAFLSDVNWREIAEHMIANYSEA